MKSDNETSTLRDNLLDGYVTENEMAKARGVQPRTLRAERQRGEGPPWLKASNKILYSAEGFREWLKSLERSPVRARRP
jgi:hypothetical protein